MTLRVDRGWKGAATGDTLVVVDSFVRGVGFEAGGRYLVYAAREDGALRTHTRTRSRPLALAADDVRVPDSIAPPP